MHAQACEWEKVLDECATPKDAERQMLVFSRLELLDPVQTLIYQQLYPVNFADEGELEPVSLCFKAFLGFCLFVVALILIFFTTAYTLSVRESPGAGAAAVRQWWRMTMSFFFCPRRPRRPRKRGAEPPAVPRAGTRRS
jgi:hypothetical protein